MHNCGCRKHYNDQAIAALKIRVGQCINYTYHLGFHVAFFFFTKSLMYLLKEWFQLQFFTSIILVEHAVNVPGLYSHQIKKLMK